MSHAEVSTDPTQQFRLDDKVVVVTGGSRGIGRGIVETYARAGADVVVASRKLNNCDEVAAHVRTTTGRRALAVAYHAGRWEDCDRLVDSVYAEFGRCDVLVNNAGMSPLYDGVLSITEEYYDKVSAVNLKGPFRLAVTIGSRMTHDGGGVIINVSTIGSLRPSGHEIVYACAKAGLNAMTIGLADAFGPAVRVNCILPGGVMTDITNAWSEEELSAAREGPALKRPGYPADFAGTALWLASDASAWVSGVLVRVDGGHFRQMS